MFIPQFITQIPTHLSNAWEKTGESFTYAKETLIDKWEDVKDSDFWQDNCKRHYERYIEPLNETDYKILAGSALVAFAISIIAIKFFGAGAFPLALGLGTLLILGACCISEYRSRKYFDSKAWEHVEKIRKAVNASSYSNQNFGVIEAQKTILKQSEYSHLDQDIRSLEEQLREFKKAVLAIPLVDRKNIVTAHIKILKDHAQAPDLLILEALENEIIKIGTMNQNMGELETRKLALHNMVTPGLKMHIPAAFKYIDELKETVRLAKIEDARATFMEQLKAFQVKLDPKKDIEELIPPAPPPPAAPPVVAPAAPGAVVDPAAPAAVVVPADPGAVADPAAVPVVVPIAPVVAAPAVPVVPVAAAPAVDPAAVPVVAPAAPVAAGAIPAAPVAAAPAADPAVIPPPVNNY